MADIYQMIWDPTNKKWQYELNGAAATDLIQNLICVDGSISVPAIRPANYPDNGFQFYADLDMRFVGNSKTMFRMLGGGTGGTNTFYIYEGDATNYAFIQVGASGYGMFGLQKGDVDAILYVKNYTGSGIRFGTNAVDRFLINATGHFGSVSDGSYDLCYSGAQARDVWLAGKLASDGYIGKRENSSVITPRYLLEPDPTIVAVWDDFISGGVTNGIIGVLNWHFYTGDSSTLTLYTGVANHPGGVYISPASGANYYGTLYLNNAAYSFLNGILEYREVWLYRDHGGVVGDIDVRMGMMDNVTYAACTNSIQVYLDNSATGDSYFHARTISGGANTDTAMTGAVFGTGNWHLFEIHYTPSSVKFYHNGVLQATHTTNIPTTNDMMPAFSAKYAASIKVALLDYYSLTYKVNR